MQLANTPLTTTCLWANAALQRDICWHVAQHTCDLPTLRDGKLETDQSPEVFCLTFRLYGDTFKKSQWTKAASQIFSMSVSMIESTCHQIKLSLKTERRLQWARTNPLSPPSFLLASPFFSSSFSQDISFNNWSNEWMFEKIERNQSVKLIYISRRWCKPRLGYRILMFFTLSYKVKEDGYQGKVWWFGCLRDLGRTTGYRNHH